MNRVQTVDEYIASSGGWDSSLTLLRELMTSTILTETVKWGMPVYTLNDKNVAGFSAFKSWAGIWFYQGVFLKDPDRKLINAQEGTTRGLRQMRFSSAKEIVESKETILAYLEEAIQNQVKGIVLRPGKNKPLLIPEDLNDALNRNLALKNGFNTLSLVRRREYAEYVGSAKRPETRQQRLEKIIPLILNGTGLNDRYRK